jgi:ABC-2 type transport system permease protein
MRALKRPLRVFAVMGKEIVEVIRRPRALVSIIAGPVLILAVFGLGFVGQPPLRTELVIPPGIGLPDDPATYAAAAGDGITISGVTADRAAARERLRRHETDLVVVAPTDARQRLAGGEQAVLTVEFDSVNPYQAFIARTAANQLVAAVNRQIIEEAARRAVDEAAAAGRPVPPEARPELVAAPTRAEVVDLAPSSPNIVSFYGIMVLALIVQHTSVTVSALSTLRDRRRGAFDILRISPIGSGEILVGKFLAFGLLGTLVALAVLVVLVVGFGVPFLAAPSAVLACLALLVAASTGVGIVIALVSDSDRQAIQLALLVLLASVFFSGLAVDLAQFSAPVRAGAELLPVTQAGRLLQELLLRGATDEAWRFASLSAIAGCLAVASWLILRRHLLRPA